MSRPSLLCVPYRYKAGVLYSQVPSSNLGDFTVTRSASNSATRVNAAGLIETVLDNVPRLDYPLGGITAGCPALLVEPSAQNLVQRSEEFNNVFWSPIGLNAFGSGSVANTTATRDPYGTNLADYIQENSTPSSTHLILAIFSGNVSGTTYTWSVFAKAAERTIINLLNNAAGSGSADFNLTTGVATLNTGVSASMENYGNGWWRCRLTYTSSASGSHNVQIRLCDASGNPSYSGTGNQGAYIFGAQLEVGSVATSYIPTAASPVTRGAETISKTGVSSLIGQTEGTIYAEVDVRNRLNGTAVLTLAKDAGVSSRVIIYTNTNNQWRANYTDASGNIVDTSAANNTQVLGINKLALAYGAGGNATLHCNGSLIITLPGTSAFVQDLQAIFLGSSNAGALFFNNRILAAELYPTRLTNAQLQSLTQ